MDQVTITVNVPRRVHVKFGDNSHHWSHDAEVNLLFLRSVQNHMNELLRIRNYVFLNEVLVELGLPRTYEGQLLGWSNGGHVDFGLFTELHQEGGEIGLVLNIDGVILDALR